MHNKESDLRFIIAAYTFVCVCVWVCGATSELCRRRHSFILLLLTSNFKFNLSSLLLLLALLLRISVLYTRVCVRVFIIFAVFVCEGRTMIASLLLLLLRTFTRHYKQY